MQWTPDKIIALVLIILASVLMCLGINGEMKAILTMAAGYFFGTSATERRLTAKKGE
jgi:hypothetical protein